MANDYKYYGGSNQIAKLPYKTIDALQQLGLYVGRNEEDLYVQLNSDLQDNDPDYSCELNAFNKINCNTLDTSTINAYNIRVNGKSIYRDFFRTIKISKNLAVTNSFTNEEVSKIVDLDQNGDQTCLLYDGSDNIVLVRDITTLRNQILSMKGVIITAGDKLGTTNIKQWSVKNSAWNAPIPFDAPKMYVHHLVINDINYFTIYSSNNLVADTPEKLATLLKDENKDIFYFGFKQTQYIDGVALQFNGSTNLWEVRAGGEESSSAITNINDVVTPV